MRGLNVKNQSKKNKKELSQQEKNILDATQMKNMSPVFKNTNSGRDTPLAPTPTPAYAQGVVVSKKDEKNNPKDFKYLKTKNK